MRIPHSKEIMLHTRNSKNKRFLYTMKFGKQHASDEADSILIKVMCSKSFLVKNALNLNSLNTFHIYTMGR